MAVDAGQDWWAISPYGDVMLDIIPNGTSWSPSPAQQASQLQGLGLMLNATGVGIGQGIGTADGQTTMPITEALALGGTASIANAQQMLDANQGVTTELAALIASGNPSGSPGGVPLIIGATPLLQQAGVVNLGPGVTDTLGPFTVGQIAYETYFEAQETVQGPIGSGGTPGAVITITLSWRDSATGLQLGLEAYNVVPAAPSSVQPHIVHGRGPSRGDQLTVTITNNDSVNVAVLATVLETSRVFSAAQWQTSQPSGVTFTGFTTPNYYPATKTIADTQPNNTAVRILPLYTGQAKILVVAGVGSLNVIINTLDPAAPALGQIYESGPLAANSRNYADIVFGNSQCTLSLVNTDVVKATVGAEIIAYPW
jgi:hypothetical protein